MTPSRNNYEFSVRPLADVPLHREHDAKATFYWRQLLIALDGLKPDQAAFMKHVDEYPTHGQMQRMTSNIAGQLKRYRPKVDWQLFRDEDVGGIYVYRLAPTTNDDHVIPRAELPDRELLIGATLHVEGDQISVVENLHPIDPSEQGPPPVPADPYEVKVERRGGPICGCAIWWKASAAYRKNDPKEVGPHHHDDCPLWSTWKDHPTLAACGCDDAWQHRGGYERKQFGPADEWFGLGNWHDAACPRHRHRFKLPGPGDDHELGTPYVGLCACGETSTSDPFGAKPEFGRENMPAPVAREGALVDASGRRTNRCATCGRGMNSNYHKTVCTKGNHVQS